MKTYKCFETVPSGIFEEIKNLSSVLNQEVAERLLSSGNMGVGGNKDRRQKE